MLGNLAFQACMEFPVYLSIVKASWAVDKEYWKMCKKLFLFAEAQLPQPEKLAGTKNVLTDGIKNSIMWF